jgi:hypothetical protein
MIMLVVCLLFHFQEKLVNWASTASEAERFRVLGHFLDCFKFEEKTGVQTKVSQIWKRKYKRERTTGSSASKPKPVVACKAGPAFADVPVSTSSPVAACVPVSSARGWWKKFGEEEICALDTEHVVLDEVYPHTNMKLMAGEVSIVNYQKEVIYHVSYPNGR